MLNNTLGRISLCLSLALIGNVEASSQDLKTKFEVSKIVPDFMDKAPKEVLKVSYQNGVSADMGNTLTIQESKSTPTINYKADGGSYYTLLMADPDAVSVAFLHWMVMNIPGNSIAQANTRAAYIGPTPPPGTGKHRYVLLVYKQPSLLNDVENAGSRRGKFNLRQFVTQFKLGEPILGNYFIVQAN